MEHFLMFAPHTLGRWVDFFKFIYTNAYMLHYRKILRLSIMLY